ncbi:LptF/LptG family permease [Pedobacter sp. P351]|uniref:LptF/LptG family permease n=1 Tax=Pedobacter superstes TaxID=3133441 RepID=UPI0030A53C91
MKKIHLLVLKAFIRPFIVTFFIVMFVLLMLFLFKYIDDLIGKGFQWYVILQLMWYASATNVAMALPLAMLLSSIMTFGSLGENYELVAIKAAGISLQKAMAPLFVLVSLLSIGAFLFSDYMLPVANLKFGSLLWDVRNQKGAFLLKEGVFNNSIPGFSIRVQQKDPDERTLYNIIIYDHNNATGNVVIRAKQGVMTKTPDESSLILNLKDGVRYEEKSGDGTYNPRQRFTRYKFKETTQKFDLSGFKMQRTDENLFKSSYAMMNLKQLKYYKDSTVKVTDSTIRTYDNMVIPMIRLYAMNAPVSSVKVGSIPQYKKNVLDIVPVNERSNAISFALSETRGIKDVVSAKAIEKTDYKKSILRYVVEYNRKFTLAVSCLILFSIGAPLGAIIRKGGLGLPVVMSVLFFLIYHIISQIGEKSAKAGTMDPILGMWIAIIVLTPLGVFLTYKAAIDSAIFDVDYYKQQILKLIKKKDS